RVLSISEKTLGPDHPSMVISLTSLAEVYMAKGDYARAEPIYLRAISIVEKAMGKDSYAGGFGFVSNKLAELYKVRGDYKRAENLYQRRLLSTEKALGPDNPYVAPYLNDLVWLHVAQGRLADAVQIRQRAATLEDHNLALNLATGSETRKR